MRASVPRRDYGWEAQIYRDSDFRIGRRFILREEAVAWAESEREKARQWTDDATLRKAKAGHVTAVRTFGYDNVPADPGGKVRVIREDEAAVVREIFARCATGEGLRTIAHALNDMQAPCPRAQQGRPSVWCPSSVRE